MRSAFIVTISLVSLLFCWSINGQAQCPNAPANPMDRRTNKTSLTIAAYNAEWLFLTGKKCPGEICPWKTVAQAELHMQAVAEAIIGLNADILSLEEVQDCSVLTRLNALLPNMSYLPYLLTGTDSFTGQNVGLLTRVDPYVNLQRTNARVNYPIPGSTCGYNGPKGNSGVSKHYYTSFNVSGLPNPLTVFGMHFLAIPDDVNKCVQREAQASVIRALVASALLEGHSTIVLGDLNDYDGIVLDQANSKPISQVLALLRNPVPTEPGDELANIAQFISQTNRYTCWWDKNNNCNSNPLDEFTSIDHILISNDLAEKVNVVDFDHSYPAQCKTLNSDHWPLGVQMQL